MIFAVKDIQSGLFHHPTSSLGNYIKTPGRLEVYPYLMTRDEAITFSEKIDDSEVVYIQIEVSKEPFDE